MMIAKQKTVLVTGASGGIGYALAQEFGVHGYQIVAVGSNQGRLTAAADKLQAAGLQIQTLVQDLSQPEAAKSVLSYLENNNIVIDVLVNNAGFATAGSFASTDYEQETREMNLNMLCLTQLTKLILPGMLDRKHGRILNVASVAAFYPGPYMSVYFATKAYVLHFSEALGYEIRGSGVTVTALCPGPTQSGFAKRAGLKADNFSGHNAPSADWVARAGYNGCMSGRQIVLPGLRNRLSVWAGRMVPRQIVTAYIGRILK